MIGFSRYFPPIRIESSCSKKLQMLGADPYRYMGMTVSVSVAFAALLMLTVVLLGIGQVLLFTVLGFAAVSGFFLILPDMEVKRRTAEIEADMPFFLRSLGMFLEMGIPFQRAVALASEGEGVLRKRMRSMLIEAERGVGLEKVFSSIAISADSLVVKRAISQLISTYEIGGSGKELMRIGDELISLERHRLKEYSARSAMFGLLFIITSAILPTFFLVYAIAGRYALGHDIGDFEIVLALLVVFPSLSVLILLLSKSTMPRSALHSSSGFDVKLLAPGGIFVFGFILGPEWQLPALIIGLGIAGFSVLTSYKNEHRKDKIEERLPDALFAVSGLPKSTRPERIFEIIESGGHGALSEEAEKSRRQLGMNLKTDSVLDDLWQRNGSELLRRACDMMKHMMNTDSLDRLSILAEDIIMSFQLRRERSQVFAMQKYTLIFGAFLIALILNMSLNLLQDMDGLFENESIEETLAFAGSIVPAYLVIYSTISATAIADAEGRKSAMATYFMVLALLGLATFYLISI